MSMQLKVNEKEYTVTYKFKVLAPRTTNMLLVGLQEEHSEEFKTFDDAKDLICNYFKENEDNQDINMLGLYTELINTMSEDGFLERIGLVDKKKQVKTPQDHKKKTTTTSKK